MFPPMQKTSGFGIGISGRRSGGFLRFLGSAGMGFLHGADFDLQMLPSGSGSPQSAERPGGRLSPGATLGGRCHCRQSSAGRVDAIVGPFTMSGSNASDLIGRSPDRRKLIAVVYADMVGYSRLIGLDDAGTLERLRTSAAT